jgi:hypothetical protein
MAKFNDLCAVYSKAQNEFRQFRDDCQDFVVDLWNNMITYLNVPGSQLSIYTINEEGEAIVSKPPIWQALTLRSDSYWSVGFGITVYEAPNMYPQETIIISLLIKKDSAGNYFVKLSEFNEEFKIDRTNVNDFDKFYNFVFEKIINSYQSGLQKFIDQESSIRKVGFQY